MTSALKTQKKSELQTVSKQELIQESAICNQTVPVLLNGMSSQKHEPEMRKNDIAITLCARDYKGFNNFGSNGVLECKKIT